MKDQNIMYGNSIVIKKPSAKQKDLIPFIIVSTFELIHGNLLLDTPKLKQELIKQLTDYLDTEPNGFTTLERLLTAPCDIVHIIDNDELTKLLDHKPLNCSKGSGNEHVTIKSHCSQVLPNLNINHGTN